MRAPCLSFARVVFVLVAFAGLVSPRAISAAEWRDLSRDVRAQINTTENQLFELKADIRQAYSIAEEAASKSREIAGTRERTANLQSDPKMRAVYLKYRDSMVSEARRFELIEHFLIVLRHRGDSLEANKGMERSFQSAVEDLAEGLNGAKPESAQLRKLLEMIDPLEKDLSISAKALLDLKKTLTEEESILKEIDTAARALLATYGSPQDRVEQLEKELVQQELDSNEVITQGVAIVRALTMRMTDIFLKTADTLKTQLEIVSSLQ